MSRDDAYVVDLLQAAQMALEFTRELNESRFLKDKKTQSATVYQLMIMGEVAKKVSPEFRK